MYAYINRYEYFMFLSVLKTNSGPQHMNFPLMIIKAVK